ncbi:unnamed protein product [Adineta steineri]|uniref:Uncharacterized protein n=1 Tax=Adineta steineri TaxID=433720 RepID=A0A813YG50_9BILA|nr:unnamed protein product [Adineta steineri]
MMNTNTNEREFELLRERYIRLADIHGQLQTQNSLLEEKILTIVELYENEKSQLEQSLGDAKHQITYLQETVNELQIEKQRYKDDCNLAVRLLHRHPNEFISTSTTGQIQEELKNRFESTSTNQPIPAQRSILIPTFPPTFMAQLPSISLPTTTTTSSSSVNTQTIPSMTTTNDNLRAAAEALFKSNSVHRSPSQQVTCSNCQRSIKRCDVSVQTSLDDKSDDSATSRLRLVSLTSSDDGHSGDGSWLPLDSPHPPLVVQEHPTSFSRPISQHKGYDAISVRSIPRMHHV